jgi:exosortase
MSRRLQFLFVPIIASIAILWAYWPTIREMTDRWADDPQYSHGYLVPLFSLFLLWFNRELIRGKLLLPCWWGIAFLAAGLGLWGVGTHFFFNWFAEISILFCLAGLALVIGGWPALRWSWQPILFLGFMVPLPYRIQTLLGGRLQQIATGMSTYAIQTLGAPAIKEGNVILINDVKIGVVEACNGLGMLMTFFAISTALAMMLRSSEKWVRAVVIVSAVPVAVLANVARITATGILLNASQDRLAHIVFHDIAGLLMMPFAIAILFLEMHLLRRIIVERPISSKDPRAAMINPTIARAAPTAR